MIRGFLWLALVAATVGTLVAIIWIERMLSVPQSGWLGAGTILLFGMLLFAVDTAIYIWLIRKFGLQRRSEPGMVELLAKVVWGLFVMVVAGVFGLHSSERIVEVCTLVMFAGSALSTYSSVRAVMERNR